MGKPTPQTYSLNQVRLFLEAEIERANQVYRQVMALVGTAGLGVFFLAGRLAQSWQLSTEAAVAGLAIGIGAYLLGGHRVVGRIMNSLHPSRRWNLDPFEEVYLLDRCLRTLRIPRSYRVLNGFTITAGLGMSACFVWLFRAGLGDRTVLVFAMLWSLVFISNPLTVITTTPRRLRRVFARFLIPFWRAANPQVEQDPRYQEVASNLDKTLLDTRKHDPIFLRKGLTAVVAAVGWIDVAALVFFSWHLMSHVLVFAAFPWMHVQFAYLAALPVLILALLHGCLWLYYETFRAHLGQLRLVSLRNANPERLTQVYLLLDGLRGHGMFYELPVASLAETLPPLAKNESEAADVEAGKGT